MITCRKIPLKYYNSIQDIQERVFSSLVLIISTIGAERTERTKKSSVCETETCNHIKLIQIYIST